MNLSAIVIGATGLVGEALVNQLLQDDGYTKVTILHRRPTGISHGKLTEHIIDFDKPASYQDLVRGHVLFNAMGTTIKKAGSQEAQYKVDVTYPLQIAKCAIRSGVDSCVVVSSAGANAESSNFYSRIKGELENSISDLSFTQVRILRPSILDGERNEFRLGERIGLAAMKLLSWIPGIRKYRPIHASIVAKAMRNSLKKEGKKLIFSLDKIFKLADQ